MSRRGLHLAGDPLELVALGDLQIVAGLEAAATSSASPPKWRASRSAVSAVIARLPAGDRQQSGCAAP